MENYDNYEKYLRISEESTGTAQEKYLSYTESLEASQKRVQAVWEELASSSQLAEFLTSINKVTAFLVEKLPFIVKQVSYLLLQFKGYKIPAALLQLLGGQSVFGQAGVLLNGGVPLKKPGFMGGGTFVNPVVGGAKGGAGIGTIYNTSFGPGGNLSMFTSIGRWAKARRSRKDAAYYDDYMAGYAEGTMLPGAVQYRKLLRDQAAEMETLKAEFRGNPVTMTGTATTGKAIHWDSTKNKWLYDSGATVQNRYIPAELQKGPTSTSKGGSPVYWDGSSWRFASSDKKADSYMLSGQRGRLTAAEDSERITAMEERHASERAALMGAYGGKITDKKVLKMIDREVGREFKGIKKTDAYKAGLKEYKELDKYAKERLKNEAEIAEKAKAYAKTQSGSIEEQQRFAAQEIQNEMRKLNMSEIGLKTEEEVVIQEKLRAMLAEGQVTAAEMEAFEKNGILSIATAEKLQKEGVLTDAQMEVVRKQEVLRAAQEEAQTAKTSGGAAGSKGKHGGMALMLSSFLMNQGLSAISNALQSGTTHTTGSDWNPYSSTFGGETVESSKQAASVYKAISSGFTLVIPFLGQTIGDIVGNLVAREIDRDRDERNARIKKAEDQLSILNKTEETLNDFVSLSKKRSLLTNEEYTDWQEKGNEYLATMYSKENAETRSLVENMLEKQLKKMDLYTEDTKSIRGVVKKIQQSSDATAERYARALQLAEKQAQVIASYNSKEGELYDLRQSGADAVADYMGYSDRAQGAWNSTFYPGMGVSAGLGLAGAVGLGVAGGSAFGPVGAIVGALAGLIVGGAGVLISKYAADAASEAEYKRLQDEWNSKSIDEQIKFIGDKLETSSDAEYAELNGILRTLEDIKQSSLRILEELDDLQAEAALLNAKDTRGNYLLDMNVSQLKQLGIDGIYDQMAKALEEEGLYSGAVYDPNGNITAGARALIYNVLRSDAEIASVLSGEAYTLNEALKLDTSSKSNLEIVKNFAEALQFSISDLVDEGKVEQLSKQFGTLKLSDILQSLSSMEESVSNILGFIDSVTDGTASIANNISTIINNYPELIQYVSDEAKLYEQILLKAEQLSNIYLKQQYKTISSTKEFYEDTILPYLIQNVGQDIEQTLIDAGITSLEDLMKWFVRDGNKELKDDVYAALSTLTEEIALVEDTVAKKEVQKIISVRSKMLEKELQNLQEQRDAIKNITSQREYENKLIEARLKLENAGKDKKRVYRAGVGWVYEADQDAIKTANEELESLKREKDISELELQIDILTEIKKDIDELEDNKTYETLKSFFEVYKKRNGIEDASDARLYEFLNNAYDGTKTKLSEMIKDENTTNVANKEATYSSLQDAWSKYLQAETDYFTHKIGGVEYNSALQNYQNEYTKAMNAGYIAEDTFSKDKDESQFGSLASKAAGEGGVWTLEGGASKTYALQEQYKQFAITDGSKQYKLLTQNALFQGNVDDFMKAIREGNAVVWYKDENGKIEKVAPKIAPKEDESLAEYIKRYPDSQAIFYAGGKWLYALNNQPWALTQSSNTSKTGADVWNADYYGQVSDFAEGSLGVPGGLSLLNELGTEAIITPAGTITSLPSASGVVPADITKNLWQLGEVAPMIKRSLFGGMNNLGNFAAAGGYMNDESFNVNTINMDVHADSSFNVDSFISAIKMRASITKNNKR